MRDWLIALFFACKIHGMLAILYRSQINTKSALSHSFGTDGLYNIQLMLSSDGEAFIEIAKEPVLRKEHSIHVECLGKQEKIRNWTFYKYNGIHNYRQSLGVFPDNETLRCTITINKISNILVAERVSKPRPYTPSPNYETFKIKKLVEDDSADDYEWTNDPLPVDPLSQKIFDEVAKEPQVPQEFHDIISSTIGSRKVYVSLTTSPGRLLRLHYTLRSLPRIGIESIFITLPKRYKGKEKYRIPRELTKEFQKLQFLSAPYDIGPALKAVGAAMYLQERGKGDDILIVIDDDNVYGPSMIETYVYFSLKYPNAAFTATHLSHITTFGFPPVQAVDDMLLRPCYIIEGFSGYATRVRNFDTELIVAFVQRNFNPELSVCYLADDVVISFALALKGIKLQTTWTDKTPLYTRINRRELWYFNDQYALHLTNSDDSKSSVVNNDPKYYSAIEIMSRYVLNWNTRGMQFRHRAEIIALLRTPYRYDDEI